MAQITDTAITSQIAALANQPNGIDIDSLISLLNTAPGVNVAAGTAVASGIYKRFGRFDKIDNKEEAVTVGLWSGDVGSLTTFYLNDGGADAQTTSKSGEYYYNVYNLDPDSDSTAEVQFAVAYGHSAGLGSAALSSNDASTLATKATYYQYKSMLLDTDDDKFSFESSSGIFADSDDIYVINLNRSRFREKMDPGNWSLDLNAGGSTYTFIDDSGKKFGDSYGKAGRVFKVVEGNLNLGTNNEATITSTYDSNGKGYGLFYPDRGIIILNPEAITDKVGISLQPNLSTSAEQKNHQKLFNAISAGGDFQARRTENVKTQHFFVRANNREFNFTNNPSFSNSDGTFVEPTFDVNPQTFITTVGLYNDANELLAVAKTSQPIPKAFDKEVLIKCKLSF